MTMQPTSSHIPITKEQRCCQLRLPKLRTQFPFSVSQIFKRDAAQLESWLSTREPVLNDPAVGASITEVEELIRRHDDFLKTIESQEDKFDALRRTTRVSFGTVLFEGTEWGCSLCYLAFRVVSVFCYSIELRCCP